MPTVKLTSLPYYNTDNRETWPHGRSALFALERTWKFFLSNISSFICILTLHSVLHDQPLISKSGQQCNVHTQQQETKLLCSPFQLALEKLRAAAQKILK